MRQQSATARQPRHGGHRRRGGSPACRDGRRTAWLAGGLLFLWCACTARPACAQVVAHGYLVTGRPVGVSTPFTPGDTLWQIGEEAMPGPVRAAFDSLHLSAVDDACTTVFTDTRLFLLLLHSRCDPGAPSEDNESGVVIRADGGLVGPVHALLPLHFYVDIHPGRP